MITTAHYNVFCQFLKKAGGQLGWNVEGIALIIYPPCLPSLIGNYSALLLGAIVLIGMKYEL